MDNRLLSATLALISGVTIAQVPESGPIPESEQSTIGYKTVGEALNALKIKPGVRITVQNGWTIIEDQTGKDLSLWSFSPAAYPAYPAVVKRTMHEQSDQVSIGMNILCQAAKAPCDSLVREFQELNDRIKQEIHSRAKEAQPAVQADRP